jgi:hypothetical protein
MQAAEMGSVVLLIWLVALVPTHGEKPSLLQRPRASSNDSQAALETLHPSATGLDEWMHPNAPKSAKRDAISLLTSSRGGDNASLPFSNSHGGDHASLSVRETLNPGFLGPEHVTDRSDSANAHGRVPVIAPSVVHISPSGFQSIPDHVLNSTAPIYMRGPIRVQTKVRKLSLVSSSPIIKPGLVNYSKITNQAQVPSAYMLPKQSTQLPMSCEPDC